MAATFRLFYFLKTPNDAQRIIARCRRKLQGARSELEDFHSPVPK